MREPEDPDDRDLRRRLLAKRLVSHRARTQTIRAFTGMSRHRLDTLRLRWGVTTEDRHRGPSPTSLLEFFRTPRNLQSATAAAVLCELLDVVQALKASRLRALPLEAGEKLCYAYEALVACLPWTDLEFEQLLLLATGLADGQCIRLDACRVCGASILVDALSVRDSICTAGCSSY